MSDRFTLCPTKFHKCPRCGLVEFATEPLPCSCGAPAVPHFLPGRGPTQFNNLDATRQATLFDGLDCLPGQQDLF
jgi:hypothetical protein